MIELLKENIFIYVAIFVLFIVFFCCLYQILRAHLLENRIKKYVLSKSKREQSIYSVIRIKLYRIIKKFSKLLRNYNIFNKLSKPYKFMEYEVFEGIYKPIDFLSIKILLGFSFFILGLFFSLLNGYFIGLTNMFILVVTGTVILDLYLILCTKKNTSIKRTEVLEAIILLNNAFLAGKTPIQAIEFVSNEASERIAREFKKVHIDISLGLSLEDAFMRLSKRTNNEDINFLTSSVIVLNKTGGNITSVFKRVEEMILKKQKTDDELKSLTGNTLLIRNFLLALPILFIFIISILSPDYFLVLINTKEGIIIDVIIIGLYLIYIYLIKKIMNVRGIKSEQRF